MIVLAVCITLLAVAGSPARARLPHKARSKRRWWKSGSVGTRQSKAAELDMGLMLSEVATRLRSGASVESAWHHTVVRLMAGSTVTRSIEIGLNENGVPRALHAIWLNPNVLRGGPMRFAFASRLARNRNLGVRFGIPPAVAACRLSQASGAPAAHILDACASGVTEAVEAAAERKVALAAPKATARMLAWLPLLGLALGWALGAAPLAFLFGTGLGKACLAAGLASECIGLMWVNRLSRKAEEEAW